MTTRKHNEFLDLPESDDEGNSQGYNSEEDDLVKSKGASTAKRRKTTDDSDESISDEEDIGSDSEDDLQNAAQIPKISSKKSNKSTTNPTITLDTTTSTTTTSSPPDTSTNPLKRSPSELPGISKPLSKKDLVATEKAIKRSGVVYISRVPPFMKPQKLRSLLTPFGTINRIFLTPEDPTSHTKRVKSGGNKKRSFTDGWVEFLSKADAKKACELLNAQLIGGKKGSYYRDDVWNLKYLKGYKWSHLTEQIAGENAERAARLRVEIGRTTRENKEFVANVERSKMLEGIAGKRARKMGEIGETEEAGHVGEVGGGDARCGNVEGGRKRKAIAFTQTAVAPKKDGASGEQAKRVSKIF